MRNRLNIYITTQLFMTMGFSSLALVGMFWLGQSVPLIEEIILRGETTATFFKLAVLLFPKIFKLLIPVAMLIAVVFTMNRLASEGELMAIHNSGQNPIKVLIPIASFAALITIVHMFISVVATPQALFSMNKQLFDIKNNYTKNFIAAKTFVSPERGIYIYADKSTLDGEMLNIFIDDRREEGFVRDYFADRALIIRDTETSKLALIDGEYHERDLKTNQLSIGKFTRFEVELDSENTRMRYYVPNLEEVPSRFLLKPEKMWLEADFRPIEQNKQLGELVDRVLFPLSSLLMPIIAALGFLGAPLSRHGYTNIIVPSVIIGLACVAFVFSMKNFIASNPSMIWVCTVPFVLVLLAIIIYNRRIYGGRK